MGVLCDRLKLGSTDCQTDQNKGRYSYSSRWCWLTNSVLNSQQCFGFVRWVVQLQIHWGNFKLMGHVISSIPCKESSFPKYWFWSSGWNMFQTHLFLESLHFRLSRKCFFLIDFFSGRSTSFYLVFNWSEILSKHDVFNPGHCFFILFYLIFPPSNSQHRLLIHKD